MDIFAPYLLPFTIPLTAVVIMLSLQLLLMLIAGVGFDFDADVDHDFDLDHDLDVDADADTQGIASKILTPLGVGEVPTSIVWQAFFLSFGAAGVGGTFLVSQWLLA
jgi:hypothetical protein